VFGGCFFGTFARTLAILRFFVIFFQENAGIVPRLGHNNLLPNPFLFNVHK
jgi:hypothetical protein